VAEADPALRVRREQIFRGQHLEQRGDRRVREPEQRSDDGGIVVGAEHREGVEDLAGLFGQLREAALDQVPDRARH
jgi:hypothetical protein